MREPRASVSHDADARSFPLAQGLLLFTPLVLLGNQLGTLLRYPETGAAVLFPPYALLTTALVVSARRHWIWYILVSVATHFVAHWPQWNLPWILVADVANTARALAAAVLIRWLFGRAPRLETIRALFLFGIAAVLVAPAIGATIGAVNALLNNIDESYMRTWRAWFFSNALTGMTLLPALVLAIASGREWNRQQWNRQRTFEAIVITTALVGAISLALLGRGTGQWPPALLFYAPLPILLWTGLRFGASGATLALTAVTFAAIWGADRRTGPFLTSSPDEAVVMLQLFVLLTSIPVLCIAVISSARQGVIELHRALLASLHDHIAILDGRGVVLEVNGAWRRFAAIDGIPFYKSVMPGDDYLGALRAGAARGDSGAARVLAGVTSVLTRELDRFEVEYDLDTPGRRGRYQLNVEALARSDGGLILRRTDLTARRQAQLEVEEQRRVLSHLARVSVLGQLSGALAHELNQPLASIATNAEAALHMLKRKGVDLDEIQEILRDIVAEDQRAAQVIRRLRALLKRGETRLQSNDTAELINEVLELAHTELITRQVTATTSVAPNVPPVLADRVQLQQVLLNLILNACEAMTSVPIPERRLQLAVTADSRNNVQFSVRDSGTGIAPELMERLFEPFVTTKAEGLGLGLSMARTIVAAHGGRIWAENNEGRGATVHCLLAAAPADTSANGPRRFADVAPPATAIPAGAWSSGRATGQPPSPPS